MSADLYSSEIDETKHGFLLIEMNVHCYLRIMAGDASSDDIGSFSLPSNQEGWKEAEKIIASLQEWVQHSKSITKQIDKK